MAPSGGGTGRGDWKMDGQHYRRCQGVHLSVPAAARGTTEGECGLISKRCSQPTSSLQSVVSFFNVLVHTGFVAVGQKIVIIMYLLMIRRDSSSNDSLSLCRDSMPSCCMSRLGVTRARTFSRPAILICLAFNPRGPYYRGYYYYY